MTIKLCRYNVLLRIVMVFLVTVFDCLQADEGGLVRIMNVICWLESISHTVTRGTRTTYAWDTVGT